MLHVKLSALIFVLILPFSANSVCLDNGNYTTNGTYSNNLDSALSSLPATIDTTTGFRNFSVGTSVDRVNALALCRADIQPPTCLGCIRNLTSSLRTSCPNQKQALDWAELCMVRYSNETIVGALSTAPYIALSSSLRARSPDQFMADVRSLLDGLRVRAAGGGPTRKAAAGNATAPDFEFVYGMVQCTPDLSEEDCGRCLIEAAGVIPGCCHGSAGLGINFPSCTLRFEVDPFYNETRLQELAARPPPPPLGGKGGSASTTQNVIIIIVVSVAACVILTVSVCIFSWKRMKRKREETNEAAIDEISTAESLIYSLSTLKTATNDFSDDNKLGQGGFGAVYKGVLPNGQEIAVKRLSQNSGQGDVEFKNEVLLLAKLQHRNLVRLLGFCLDGMEKLLIYEFVMNASLNRFIFDPIKRSYLDWEKRYKIIIGVARGILYLHEDSQLRIVHRDLKPSNVLLDGAMHPKIADFGMARLFKQDETQGNTSKIAGTFGYMAPEYAMHGQFSVKSDVFSFGVLILEIISGQKNSNVGHGESSAENLLSLVWKNWCGSTVADMVDPCLRSGSGGSISDVIMRCIHIGLLCVQQNAADRPTMASVILMLNSSLMTMTLPNEPAFYMGSDSGSDTFLQHDKLSRSSVQHVTDFSP